MVLFCQSWRGDCISVGHKRTGEVACRVTWWHHTFIVTGNVSSSNRKRLTWLRVLVQVLQSVYFFSFSFLLFYAFVILKRRCNYCLWLEKVLTVLLGFIGFIGFKVLKHNNLVWFKCKWHKTEDKCCAKKLTGLTVAGRSLAQDVKRNCSSCFLFPPPQFAKSDKIPFWVMSSRGELLALHVVTRQN